MASKAKRGTFTLRKGSRMLSFSYSEEHAADTARDYLAMAAWLREMAVVFEQIAEPGEVEGE